VIHEIFPHSSQRQLTGAQKQDKMDQYNEVMDKIGDAIIAWSDPTGKWKADRDVSLLCGCWLLGCVECRRLMLGAEVTAPMPMRLRQG
jgi:hypothetical protein